MLFRSRDVDAGASIVTLMGDGGTGTFLRALQIIQGEVSVRRNDHVFVAPGGTMNLIAKAAGITLDQFPDFLMEGKDVQEVRLRELVLRNQSNQEIAFPWAAFAGVGLDAEILRRYDVQSRNNHVLTNVALAALGLAPKVIVRDDEFTWDMAMAVSQLGLMRFNPKRFDRLGAQDFHRIQLRAKSGMQAAVEAIALQFAGVDPRIADFYWLRGPAARRLDIFPGHAGFRAMMEKAEPRLNADTFRPHPLGETTAFHLDGYPHVLPRITDYHFRTVAADPVRIWQSNKI